MNLSYSLVNSLLSGCPWSVALDKIVKAETPTDGMSLRTLAGSALHAALELHESRRREYFRTRGVSGDAKGADRFELESVVEWYVTSSGYPFGYPFTNPGDAAKETDQCKDEALNGLSHFYETPITKGQLGAGGTIRDLVMSWRPVAVERRFETYDRGVRQRPLVGSADCVYLDDHGDLLVVDWKSATNLGRYGLDGAYQRLQGSTYARALVEAINLPGHKGLGYWPKAVFAVMRTTLGVNANFQGVRVIDIDPTDADMQALDAQYVAAEQIIDAGVFPKDPEAAGVLCQRYCSHNVSKGGTCYPQAPPEFDIRSYA